MIIYIILYILAGLYVEFVISAFIFVDMDMHIRRRIDGADISSMLLMALFTIPAWPFFLISFGLFEITGTNFLRDNYKRSWVLIDYYLGAPKK